MTQDGLMLPSEVAAIFGVGSDTIGRLAEPSGGRPALFHAQRTLGGHRRYPADEVWRIHRYLNGRPLVGPYTRRDRGAGPEQLDIDQRGD